MDKIKKGLLILSDMLLINICYMGSIFIVANDSLEMLRVYFYVKLLPITLVYMGTFILFRLYKSLWAYASIDEFMFLICGNMVAGILAFGLDCIIEGKPNFQWMIMAIVFATAVTIGFRVCYRVYRRGSIYVSKVNKKGLKERVMIVGTGSAGVMILKEMLTSEYMNLNPVALIDDNLEKLGKSIHGVKVMGTTDDICKISKEQFITTIIVAMPSVSNDIKANIIRVCKDTGCKVKTIPGLYEIINGTVKVSNIRDVELEDLLGRDQVKLNMNEISSYIKDKIVMVTGGGGSIGSELCRQIVRFNPKQLIILDIYENNAYDIQNELKRKYPNLNLKVLVASVRDRKRIDAIYGEYNPKIVFHAAAHKHVPLMEDSPGEAIKNNVFGTLNLVELAHKHNVEKFVLISTDKAVNPTNIMGATKRMCEMIIQAMDKQSNTEFAAVRFGNVLGSNGSVIPLFKKQISEGGPLTVTHREITRYFMLIPEAAQLVLQAGAYANGGEVFVLDMGQPVKIYDLACDLIKLSGFEPHKDIEVKVTGLRPGEKLYEELLMAEEGLQKTGHDKIFVGKPTFNDMEKLKRDFNELRMYIDEEKEIAVVSKVEEIVPNYNRGASEDEIAMASNCT